MAKQYVSKRAYDGPTEGLVTRDIYAEWEQSGGDLGAGAAGRDKGNRLPFDPALQKPGVVPFKVKKGS